MRMSRHDGSDLLPDSLLAAAREMLADLLAEPSSRQALGRFAARVAELLDEHPVVEPQDAAVSEPASITPEEIEPAPPAEPVISTSEAISQLKWSQQADTRLTPEEREETAEKLESTSDPSLRPMNWRVVPDSELPLIAARARLKAESCRWKLERRRLLDAGRRFAEEIEPRDLELISRAKQFPDCFLWMNYHDGPTAGAASAWDMAAECFETTAAAAELMEDVLPHADDFSDLFHQSLELAAEAQSALRSAIRGVVYDDEPEQDRMYNWLKRTAGERGQYIARYMRADDAADPTGAADLRVRLDSLREALEERRANDRQRRKRLGQLKYLSGEIQQDREADHAYHWQKLFEAVNELVALGEPPSSKEIRGRLLPILEEMPAGDLPDNVGLVLREIDRFMAENPEEEPEAVETRPTPEIEEVARRLEGQTLVLIGGVRKPSHVQALQEAFRLKEVVWVPTREHQSVTKFEPYVRQPDVAVVVLAIRWTSHSYGEVKDFCETYGKPFVRLKAGYNPAQVATQILEQVSDQLPVRSAKSESA
jgi:hypothetical protein